jgi:hypothetical protein
VEDVYNSGMCTCTFLTIGCVHGGDVYMRDTTPKTYRVTQETIDGVKLLAGAWGMAEGEVVDEMIRSGVAAEKDCPTTEEERRERAN